MPSLEQVLRATSRTFAIGIEGLARPLREQLRLAYLVLRVSDYLEDNTTLDPEEKASLLRAWAETLEGRPLEGALLRHLGTTDDPSPDSMAAHHASAIVRELRGLPAQPRSAIVHHTRDSTLGMARWVLRGPRIETEADLDDYMHEVAGRVGYVITELFALESIRVRGRKEELMALGQEFGLALQTVNVVRGIPNDLERGWFFVPASFLPPDVESPEAFLAPDRRASAVEVVDRLLDKACRHFRAAQEYILRIPPFEKRMRFFCLLPYLFGVRTVALSRGDPAVLKSEVKLARAEVRHITRWAGLLGWSDRWIQGFAEKLRTPPS
jgi:farnesyl-diphosphate farnesyltransferase